MKATFWHLTAGLFSLFTSCGHLTDANVTASKTDAPPAAGQTQGAETLTLGVALHFRNEAALNSLLTRLYDPKSPDYGKFLTPDEFQARFGPSPEDVARARVHLSKKGLRVSEAPHGQFLQAHATFAQAERAFGTKIRARVTEDGHKVRTLSVAPKLPAGIAAVHNLKTPPRRHPYLKQARSQIGANPAPSHIQHLMGPQIRSVYNVPPGATSKDRYLALVELDGYNRADVETYAWKNGLTMPKLTNFNMAGFDGRVQSPDAQIEVTMDIEVMLAMAGAAKEIRVYATTQDKGTLLQLFNEIANPTLGDKAMAHIVSCSWGAPEQNMSSSDALAESMVFKQMAAQGQTVFAASGDSGAKDDGETLGTDDPASQPYVVAVGGTTLSSNNGVYLKESAWYDGQGGGGGGGVSRFWPMPAWQQGVVSKASLGSLQRRNVPDVALNSDPETGYMVFVAGRWLLVGGTSCAAPIWAAFHGIVNTQRGQKGLQDIGFLSPTLYRLGATPGGSQAFHDIADASTNGYYPAVRGFDEATGWGSMNGAKYLSIFTAN